MTGFDGGFHLWFSVVGGLHSLTHAWPINMYIKHHRQHNIYTTKNTKIMPRTRFDQPLF